MEVPGYLANFWCHYYCFQLLTPMDIYRSALWSARCSFCGFEKEGVILRGCNMSGLVAWSSCGSVNKKKARMPEVIEIFTTFNSICYFLPHFCMSTASPAHRNVRRHIDFYD